VVPYDPAASWGKAREATMREHFYWPGMDAAKDSLVRTCAICQQCKLTAVKKYG